MKSWKKGNLKYIQPGDPEAWIDFPPPRESAPPQLGSSAERCSICRGHGGWNLLLGAFPVTSLENTSEIRHMYSHMKATCQGCSGHGWVRPEGRGCVHEYRWVGVSGKLTHFTCVHCNSTVSWDTKR